MPKAELYQLAVDPCNSQEWQEHLNIQRQFLTPPNESEWDLSQLRFGKRDYCDITTITPAMNPANEPYWQKYKTAFGKGSWRLRPDWQAYLPTPDKYAMKLIHLDPSFDWCVSDGGIARNYYQLWNPTELFASMFGAGLILDIMLKVFSEDLIDTRPLTQEINYHFRSVHLPAYQDQWLCKREDSQWNKWFLPITWDQHKTKATRIFEDSAYLVSGCMLNHMQVWNEEWFPYIIQSPAINEITAAAAAKVDSEERNALAAATANETAWRKSINSTELYF